LTNAMKKSFKHGAMTFLLSLVLVAGLMGSSCLFTQAPAYKVETIEESSEYHIQYDWSYGGQRWRYEADIPITVYQHFADKERPSDYREYVYNEMDDDWLGYTASSFGEIADDKDWDDIDTINFVMKFVQYLPYESDENTTGELEYMRYPVETMIDCGIGEGVKGVDCEDTVMLLVSILREMGYEVALLLYPEDEHMAAGVRVSQMDIDNWNEGYTLTYYEMDSKIWAYGETTAPAGSLGYKPDKITSLPQIIELV